MSKIYSFKCKVYTQTENPVELKMSIAGDTKDKAKDNLKDFISKKYVTEDFEIEDSGER